MFGTVQSRVTNGPGRSRPRGSGGREFRRPTAPFSSAVRDADGGKPAWSRKGPSPASRPSPLGSGHYLGHPQAGTRPRASAARVSKRTRHAASLLGSGPFLNHAQMWDAEWFCALFTFHSVRLGRRNSLLIDQGFSLNSAAARNPPLLNRARILLQILPGNADKKGGSLLCF